MSPEQARGEGILVDGRSDIFSLGVVLYELLTGTRPFTGVSRDEMLFQITSAEPRPPRQRDDSIHPLLEEVCLKALAKSVDQRYTTARDMADDLRKYLSESSSVVHDATSQVGLQRIPIRRVFWSALAIGVCLLIASGLREHLKRSTAPLVTRFEVIHIGNAGPRSEFRTRLMEHRAPREEDDLRVEVVFSRPTYCYLIAFNPDGSVQLCTPPNETARPNAVREFGFPEAVSQGFGLTDGAGQQVFVLVASARSLPPFANWRQKMGRLHYDSSRDEGFWLYREGEVAAFRNKRGSLRPLKGCVGFEQLCREIEQNVTAAAVLGYSLSVAPLRREEAMSIRGE